MKVIYDLSEKDITEILSEYMKKEWDLKCPCITLKKENKDCAYAEGTYEEIVAHITEF